MRAVAGRSHEPRIWHSAVATSRHRCGTEKCWTSAAGQLEVLRTPGHTPDSICLLDRANGLLFTGDTYYSGEIYLWSPETSVADYTASIGKLAALDPGLKKLLPAHGPPVAEPGRLSELQAALQDIAAGRATAEPAPENRRLFRFANFTILMTRPCRTRHPIVLRSDGAPRRAANDRKAYASPRVNLHGPMPRLLT